MSYIEDAIDQSCSPASIVVGNLVGIQTLDEAGGPDDVLTLGDVLGDKCSDTSGPDCGKVLAVVYRGLMLPFCTGASFGVSLEPLACEIVDAPVPEGVAVEYAGSAFAGSNLPGTVVVEEEEEIVVAGRAKKARGDGHGDGGRGWTVARSLARSLAGPVAPSPRRVPDLPPPPAAGPPPRWQDRRLRARRARPHQGEEGTAHGSAAHLPGLPA